MFLLRTLQAPALALCLVAPTYAQRDDCPEATYDVETYDTVGHLGRSAMGDLDGDGDPDLVVCRNGSPGRLGVHFNDGAGRFGPYVEYSVAFGSSDRAPALGDFDLDGDLDIMTCERSLGEIYLLRNRGFGSFEPAQFVTVVAGARHPAVADFNGDGAPDLSIVSTADDTVVLLLNDGSGGFPELRVLALQGSALKQALADLDGDGDIDVATGASTGVTMHFNDGDANFDSERLPEQFYAYGLTAGDLDGDGDPDLAFGTLPGPGNVLQMGIIYNKGNRVFASEIMPARGVYSELAIVDLDSDGDADIATLHIAGGVLRAVYNQGDGEFEHVVLHDTPQTSHAGSEWLRSMLVGDLDGDADIDIVASGPHAKVTVLRHVCASCAADVTTDGRTDVDDLLAVLLDWGAADIRHGGDVDESGAVDVADLIFVVTHWGVRGRFVGRS